MTEVRFPTVNGIDYTLEGELFAWKITPDPCSPVTISVPHDGFSATDLTGLLSKRENGVMGRDKHVWPIAKDIALSVPINLVRGFFPRAFIDFNRSWPVGINYYPSKKEDPQTALDYEGLAEIYHGYHASIREVLDRSARLHGKEKCLLIDLHGFGKQPSYGEYDIILGTGNRATLVSDVDKALAASLADCGYSVFLPHEEMIGPLEDIYSADFTTRHHHEVLGINVIQMEIHKTYRTFENQEKGIKLANDLARFMRTIV